MHYLVNLNATDLIGKMFKI